MEGHTENGNGQGISVSTGVEAFDARTGGLSGGRYYVLSGAPGSGKTSAALHMLGAGIEAGETVAVLTQEDPADLVAQAEFLGYDFRAAEEQDRLLLFRYRLDFQRHYSRVVDAAAVFEELKALLWDKIPQRFVVDSVLPLLEGGFAAEESVDAFAAFLEEIPCTTYLTVPGDLSEAYYRRMYTQITAGAAGIFHFEVLSGGARQMTIRKLRRRPSSMDPVRFTIRPGAGIVEDLALRSHDEVSEEKRRRVVLLTMGGKFPPEWLGALQTYDLTMYESTERAFGDLASAQYGALLIAIDPMAADAAMELTKELRRAGNGAPILYVSPSRGLRGNTRAQGLRAGGDDFLTDELTPGELVARIDGARIRGHRRLAPGAIAAAPPHAQPTDADGRYLLLPADLFREVVQQQADGEHQAFFALVLLQTPDGGSEAAWQVLRSKLRIKDGDMVAQMEDGQLALYLHDIHRKHVKDLLERLSAQNPGFADLDNTVVLSFPADRDSIVAWLTSAPERAMAGPVRQASA